MTGNEMITIKATEGNETIYRNFWNEKGLSKKAFVKKCKSYFCGFDKVRVVKSTFN